MTIACHLIARSIHAVSLYVHHLVIVNRMHCKFCTARTLYSIRKVFIPILIELVLCYLSNWSAMQGLKS